MIEILLAKWLKRQEKRKTRDTQYAYGIFAQYIGILCNLFLFVTKLGIGIMMQAHVIVSDAFNNLSDCLTNIVSVFGFKAASKPADEKHPFGHGRIEYLLALLAAVFILFVAFELFAKSIDRFFHPLSLRYNPILLVLLVLSVFVKFWMSHFYQKMAKKSGSLLLQGAATDARGDMLITSVTVISVVLSHFFAHIPFDCLFSLFVAVFIFKAGIELAKDVVDRLLGSSVNEKMRQSIEELLSADTQVLGVHDIVVHDYGMHVVLGSAHIELDSRLSFMQAHQISDRCERNIKQRLAIDIVIHADPHDIQNPRIVDIQTILKETLYRFHPSMSFHDLQLHNDILTFDITLPYDYDKDTQPIQQSIQSALLDNGYAYTCEIIFDRGYIEDKV